MFRFKQYDFIFLGAGCASLSLLVRMLKSGRFGDKKMVIIDKAPKTKNDRTWCFWEERAGFFEEIVCKEWEQLSFLSDGLIRTMDISPYRYKMIRGIDFYKYCFDIIEKHSNVEIVYGQLGECRRDVKDMLTLTIDKKEHFLDGAGTTLFNSIYKPVPGKKTIRLLQHFKGWLIETKEDAFDPGTATMMDFRVHQHYGTSFVYVLPLDKRTALVEYTQFTKACLEQYQYDEELKAYIKEFLTLDDYKVKEEEFGVIPMSTESSEGIGVKIGTAGGQTKASTGFTFRFIQKQSEQILSYLLANRDLGQLPVTPKRFGFYDQTLLHILYHEKLPGGKIFTDLFKKNKPQEVLRFLDNESSFKEELKIISSLPAWPFLKAALAGGK